MFHMSEKTITGRTLRQQTPEEALAPGESVRVKKRNGKVFELKRLDAQPRSITKAVKRIMQEVPLDGPVVRVNLSKILVEDRE